MTIAITLIVGFALGLVFIPTLIWLAFQEELHDGPPDKNYQN